MKHDRLVPREVLLVRDQVVDVEMSVGAALAAQGFTQERALDHQNLAFGEPRDQPPDAGAGVAAIGEPDVLPLVVNFDAAGAERGDLGRASPGELRLELLPAAQQVEAEARHDVVGPERLEGETVSELDAVAGSERYELEAVVDPLEPAGGAQKGVEVGGDLERREDSCRALVMKRALRENVRRAQGVVEMTVREEEIGRSGELAGAAAGVEGEAGRLKPEPGLLAGDRMAFDGEIPVAEDGARRRPPGRRQISW